MDKKIIIFIENAIKVCRKYYNLEVKLVKIFSNGSFNLNGLFISEEGLYVVKYIPIISEKFIFLQNEASTLLKGKYELYQCSLKNSEGEVVTKIENTMWMVKEYVEGRTLEFNNVYDAKQSAKGLARLHNYTKKGGKQKNDIITSEILDSISNINNLENVLINYFGIDESKKMFNFFLKVADDFQKSYKKNKNDLVLCHGDFHANNLIFNDKGILVNIIDWDNTTFSYREYDLGKALFLIPRKEHGKFDNQKYLKTLFMNEYIEYSNIKNSNINEEFIKYCTPAVFLPNVEYLTKYINSEKKFKYLKWRYDAMKNYSNIFDGEF